MKSIDDLINEVQEEIFYSKCERNYYRSEAKSDYFYGVYQGWVEALEWVLQELKKLKYEQEKAIEKQTNSSTNKD